MSHHASVLTCPTLARAATGVLLAAATAMMLAGCARQQDQHEAQAAVPPPVSRPAYCEPSSAPDCAFKGSKLKTVDPAEFARLKLAYERRCIRRAEKAEQERMRELHAAGLCGDRAAPTVAASR